MRWGYGRITLLLLGLVVLIAVALGIVLGTDLFFPPVPFPLIGGGAALACLLVLRLRGSGPGPGARPRPRAPRRRPRGGPPA